MAFLGHFVPSRSVNTYNLLPVILIQWILRNECAKTSLIEAPYLCATVNSKQKHLCCIL